MSEKVKGKNDSIFGVIRMTDWIFWIHEMYFLKTDNSKTYGWISMKFSGYVWKGKKKKWFNFWSDSYHYLDLLDP